MNWDNVKFFIATARAGSLTLAAQALHTSPATLSRRIAALERECGTTLFTRTHTGYLLTRDGTALMERCEAIDDAFSSLARMLPMSHRGASGVVRLATSENLASHFVLPALPRLVQAHPHLSLELKVGAQTTPLREREVDMAVRLSMPSTGNFKGRVIGRMAHAIYARAGGDKVPGSTLLPGWTPDCDDTPIAQAALRHTPGQAPRWRFNSLQAQVAAALAGLGRAYLPCFLGDATAGLVRVQGPTGLLDQKIYLVLHNDSIEMRRVRVVADFTIEVFRDAADRLGGTGNGPGAPALASE